MFWRPSAICCTRRVSRPEEQLFLSWHVADDDGETTSRSLFVDDVCDLFAESLSEERLRRPLGAVDGVRRSSLPRTQPGSAEPLRDEQLLAGLREHVWSATSLEKWISCPVAWFVERMLRPDAFEPDPEPFARGGLAHAALKDTLEGLRRETGSARITPANLRLARELLAAALAGNEADPPSVGVPRAPDRRAAAPAGRPRALSRARRREREPPGTGGARARVRLRARATSAARRAACPPSSWAAV